MDDENRRNFCFLCESATASKNMDLNLINLMLRNLFHELKNHREIKQ